MSDVDNFEYCFKNIICLLDVHCIKKELGTIDPDMDKKWFEKLAGSIQEIAADCYWVSWSFMVLLELGHLVLNHTKTESDSIQKENLILKCNALVRRESITNDVLICDKDSGLITPQALSELYINEANMAFSKSAPFKAYFSSSGALAVESAMKIAYRYKHYQLVSKYGYDFERKLMNDLGVSMNMSLVHPEDKLPLYIDYPFYFIAMKGAFHGRSFGALSLTHFRPVQKRGYPSFCRVKHITYNGDAQELIDIIDVRSLKEIYDEGDDVAALIQNGRVPRELVAGLILEPMQGEAGYILAKKEWIESIYNLCK